MGKTPQAWFGINPLLRRLNVTSARRFRDVEDLLAERGIEVSYETIRQWVTRFGPAIARHLRSRRPRPHRQWHLDEMFVSISGKWMYLWRAVDAEGEVLDCLVQHDDCHRSRGDHYISVSVRT